MKPKLGRMETGHRAETREQVWLFVRSYMKAAGGRSPTVREILSGVGLRSLSNVQRTLGELETDGRIRREGWGKTRTIRIVGARYLLPEEAAEEETGK